MLRPRRYPHFFAAAQKATFFTARQESHRIEIVK